MSRDLTTDEAATFHKLYGKGRTCIACGSSSVSVRIWEGYNSPAKVAGGDIGPDHIVAAVVICTACGHGETVPRAHIRKARAA